MSSQPTVTKDVRIPGGVVGLVIGKGGTKLEEFKRLSGVLRINITGKRGDAVQVAQVSGTPSAVADCARRILEVANADGGNRAVTAVPAGAEPLVLRVQDVRFTHSKISPKFSCGRRVQEVADGLREDPALAVKLPQMEFVFYNGAYYSVSNRRLFCYKHAGIQEVTEGVHFRRVETDPHFFRGLTTQSDGAAVGFFGEKVCEHCGKEFERRTALLQHMDEMHGQAAKGGTTCKFCGSTFGAASSRMQHETLCPARPKPQPRRVTGREVTQEVLVPEAAVRRIIGKGGTGIEELKRLSGVLQIVVAAEPPDGPAEALCAVRVTGAPECVGDCERRMLELLPAAPQAAAAESVRLKLRVVTTGKQALLVVARGDFAGPEDLVAAVRRKCAIRGRRSLAVHLGGYPTGALLPEGDAFDAWLGALLQARGEEVLYVKP